MSNASHFIRWELHEHPYRSLPGIFVLDDASIDPVPCGLRVVRVSADALTLPLAHHPDPDDLLTETITPWLENWIAHDARPFRWSRSMFTRNRFGRHRAASDVNSLRQLGIASTPFEDESAMESHVLRSVHDLAELVRHTRHASAGSLSFISPPESSPDSLLDRLVSLRAAHGERLRLQHCAEALTPLGVIVLSREWNDGGEASREIVLPKNAPLPPLPYHRPL
jgi:hypothetical protein